MAPHDSFASTGPNRDGWIDNPSDMASIGDLYGQWQFSVRGYDARHLKKGLFT